MLKNIQHPDAAAAQGEAVKRNDRLGRDAGWKPIIADRPERGSAA
jgi:hypothetical protein